MTLPTRQAAQLVGTDRRDVEAAEAILGARHPLTLALSRTLTLTKQLLVAASAVAVGAVALVLDVPGARLLLGAGAFVAAIFFVALVMARRVLNDNVEAVVASGLDSVLIAPVVRTRRKLGSPGERERLAGSLERLLRDAHRWNQILPQFRPLPGVEKLRDTAPEAEAVISLLRSGGRMNVQGAALVARFLGDGISSPLYGGDVQALRAELGRIRYVLESGAAPVSDVEARRAA